MIKIIFTIVMYEGIIIVNVTGDNDKCPSDYPYATANGIICCQSTIPRTTCKDDQIRVFSDVDCCGTWESCSSHARLFLSWFFVPKICESYRQTGTCPRNVIYPYMEGMMCCKYNLDMNGNEITDTSSSCKNQANGESMIQCKFNLQLGVRCHPRKDCPETHPYAYKNGERCCTRSMTKHIAGVRRIITLTEMSCYDDESISCPEGHLCKSLYFFCNSNYPYVSDNGKMCCKTNEGVDCVECENGICNRRKECPEPYPYAYWNGDYCCDEDKTKGGLEIGLNLMSCAGIYVSCNAGSNELCINNSNVSDR
jgi:hypothetical protein